MNWLFLKGIARTRRHWDQLPQTFEAAMPEARLFFLDLPGLGEAVERRAALSVPGIVTDLRARWLELAACEPGPWAVLAISLGGMIAIEWMSRHPRDFERGVVLVSSAGNLSPPWRRIRPAVLPGYLRSLGARELETRERLILGTIVNDAQRRERLVEEYAALDPPCPIPKAACARQLLAASLWRAPRTLEPATLFLGSEGDRMVHPSCTRRLAARYAGALAMNSWAGHEIPMDDPDWIAQQTRAWLAAAGPR